MAASTGPDSNTYRIPEVELADTFNTWRDISNTQAYKLNKMRVYDGVSSSSISITVAGGGTLQAQIADNVGKGVTFEQPVRFMSGVTFDGDVTFNAQRFTVNASVVTIDDYAVILGDTGSASDSEISSAGGGGILLNRGSAGSTAQWIWTPTQTVGATGQWTANAHIGLCGSSSGIIPPLNSPLSVYGQGIRVTGRDSVDHGLEMSFYGSGTTTGRNIAFTRYAPSGSTAFAEVLVGSTYGSRPFFNIKDGANRKTIVTTPGPLKFGMPVRIDSNGNYLRARATDAVSAEVVGVVSLISTTSFEVTFLGEIFGDFREATENGQNLVTGETYYLSPNEQGKITSTQPVSAGTVHKAVMIATGANSAVVLPFTGGVLAAPVQLANASTVATTIDQVNRFRPGDVVRFRATTPGLPGTTLSYSIGGGNTLQAFYTHGAFVKAQANSAEEAEIAGMVLSVDGATGTSGLTAYAKFDVIMDGFFTLPTGSLTPGAVYFLNTNCAGTSNGFESATSSFVTSPPTANGTVRKPLFMATSPVSGYLFSYRGDVRGPVVGITTSDLTKFLVRDLRSGISGDLDINVYNATDTGKNSVKVAAGPSNFSGSVGVSAGYVGVNGDGSWQSWSGTNAGSRILVPLDVQGTVRVGERRAANTSTWLGRDLIIARDSDDPSSGRTAESFSVIGTDYTTNTAGPSLVIGRGVRPNRNASGFVSSLGGVYSRSSLQLGVTGSPANNYFSWQVSESSSAALGAPVTLTNVFSITGRTASFAGGVGIGVANPTVPLDVNGLARSNVAVTSITDPKHLATKEYVDTTLGRTVVTLTGRYDHPSPGNNPIGYVIDTGNTSNIFTITNIESRYNVYYWNNNLFSWYPGHSYMIASVGLWAVQFVVNVPHSPVKARKLGRSGLVPATYRFNILIGQGGDDFGWEGGEDYYSIRVNNKNVNVNPVGWVGWGGKSFGHLLGQAHITDHPGTFTAVATRLV